MDAIQEVHLESHSTTSGAVGPEVEVGAAKQTFTIEADAARCLAQIIRAYAELHLDKAASVIQPPRSTKKDTAA